MAFNMTGWLARARTILKRPIPLRNQLAKRCDKPDKCDKKSAMTCNPETEEIPGGDPYQKLPIDLSNSTKVIIIFFLYSTAFWLPPVVVHWQIYKRSLY